MAEKSVGCRSASRLLRRRKLKWCSANLAGVRTYLLSLNSSNPSWAPPRS